MLVLVIIAYSLLVIYESVPIYKQKQWMDFWINLILSVFSFTMAILLSLNIKVPSPVLPIQEFITSIFGK